MKQNGLKRVCSNYKGGLLNRNCGLLQRNSEKASIHDQVERQPCTKYLYFTLLLTHPFHYGFYYPDSTEARVKEKAIDEVSKSWSSGARVGIGEFEIQIWKGKSVPNIFIQGFKTGARESFQISRSPSPVQTQKTFFTFKTQKELCQSMG